MDPALGTALLWLLFGGTHVVLATGPVRGPLVARLGERGFAALFSLVATATFAALVTYYAAHRTEGGPGFGLGTSGFARLVLMAMVVLGVVLLAGTVEVYPRSPMAVFGGRGPRTPYGLERITRHPFFVGIALLASAHVLLATRAVGTVFMLGFTVLAVVGAWHQDRKLVRLRGRSYDAYVAETSLVPFAAILTGRQRFALNELPVAAVIAGIGVAVLLRTIHDRLFAGGGWWFVLGTVLGAVGFTLLAVRAARRRRSDGAPAVGAATAPRRA
jgi:uncharacterized membrane protein